ncbi:MAG TPA: hypothetical protein PLS34_08660 [Gammaproteobacteria bacterium]|nr:hypothetical protein [Gammaproteobacteria bacterium]
MDEDPLLLMRQAEAAVLAVTRYLAAQDGPPPAWRDAPTGHAAADIRRRLLARNDGPVATHLALQSPNWTLGTRDASVLGPYRLDDRQGLLETGFLHVELARSGRQWRVAAVRLDPSP